MRSMGGLSLDLGLVNHIADEELVNGDESPGLSSALEYLKRLEDERRKIHVFKRELPLCMILIDNVIFRLKQENKATDFADKGEERRVDVEDDAYEKNVWSNSFYLRAAPNSGVRSLMRKERNDLERDDRSTCDNPNQECNYKKKGSGFKPWKAVPVSDKAELSGEVASKMTELSLVSTISGVPELGTCDLTPRARNGRNQVKTERRRQQQEQPPIQDCKKKRRCWSPELHRRFVAALEQLGGCHSATPKQIRELMKLDGLSNDEVKSHLQKYRLHLQKHPSFSSGRKGFRSMIGVTKDQLKHPISSGGINLLQTSNNVSSSTSHSIETGSDDRCESFS